MIPTDKSAVSVPTVLGWGLLNCLLLGIGAGRFSLWAHHPFPREMLSLPEVVCGQVVFGSMLFPLLAKSPGSLLINLLLMLPVTELAGVLSNAGQTEILRSFGFVCLWIGGMAGWCGVVKSDAGRLRLVCLASMFVVGGAVLDYLRWEVAAGAGVNLPVPPNGLIAFFGGGCQAMNPSVWIASINALISVPLMLTKAHSFRFTKIHHQAS